MAPSSAPEALRFEDTPEAARRLLEIVRRVALELHPHLDRGLRVGLESSLERDLGFDSLGRVELGSRLEEAFAVRLDEDALWRSKTPAELLAVLVAGGRVPTSESRPLADLRVGPVETLPDAAVSLPAVLDWHAERHADRVHLVLYGSASGGEANHLSYGELRRAARAVADGLSSRGLGRGDCVAIMLPTGRAFFEAFFGVLYAGGVPVPIYPPLGAARLEDHLRRQVGILSNAQARFLISFREAAAVAAVLRAQVRELRGAETVETLAHDATAGGFGAPVGGDETALLQYTSGSTGRPKGVVLTHANLLANIRAMGRAMAVGSQDVFVSWLPLYHDMGLIGAWLGSLYHAVPVVILSPLTFLARPAEWLWAIFGYRATLSAAPNFAFELCLRRIADADLVGLDLSSLRMVANGAEPVSAATIRRFTERFARYGFRPGAMAPVYGLAESSVGLAFPPVGRPPKIDRIDRRALTREGRAVKAAAADASALEVVACGRPLPGHELRVVDASGRELPERHEGRLHFRGPSATRGYFRNEEKTRELFVDGWLDTGDLAYMADGDLHLTGRIKDLIIRAGRNVYPHEVEEAVGDIPGVRKGCVAVFGSADPGAGTERIVVLAETRERAPEACDRLREQVNAVATSLLDGPPDEVVLVPPHSVLKTSSGKIRRAASREAYEGGRLGRSSRAVWWQIIRLAWASALPELRRRLHVARDVAYAAYWWSWFLLVAAIALPLIVGLPRQVLRRAAFRAAARAFLFGLGGRLEVEGLELLPRQGGVVVANHASYLDGLVLSAALPVELRFVANREIAHRLVPGLFLRAVGALLVDRLREERGVEDTRRAAAAVRRQERLVFFPEGTIRRTPGLLPFRMGAFVVAADARETVVPVGLRGTRSVLRPDQWFPRRGPIAVRVGEPLEARGSGWDAAVELRDAARVAVLRLCGEPDLAAGGERAEFPLVRAAPADLSRPR